MNRPATPRASRRTRNARAARPLLALLALAPVAAGAANNCAPADFVDRRGQANVAVAASMSGNRYSPACVTIAEGATVTFSGNFSQHPLFAGLVSGGAATFDPASPIGSRTSGTTPLVVAFPAAGEFPYFCDFHFEDGMMGSVRVVPEFFADGFE